MLTTLYILLGSIGILILILLLTKKRRPPGFPPGPFSIPPFGNLHQIGKLPHKGLIKLGKKYGNIFAFDFGTYQSIVINDLKLMKKYLNEHSFSGRPKLRVFLERSRATFARGIILSELSHWQEQRRFVLKNLRDFGFGKTSMQSIILEEIFEFLEYLRKEGKNGKPVKTKGLFNAAVLNSLWRICTGEKTPQNDPKLQAVLKTILESAGNAMVVALFFPTLTKWFPNLTGFNKLVACFEPLTEFVMNSIQHHRETNIKGQPRDLVDVIVEELYSTTDPASSFYKEEGEKNAKASLEDLFLGGAETTSTALTWICLILALQPEIQEKLHREINEVIGDSRNPDLNDRNNMPYTECLIMEVLRFVTLFPLAIMHSITEEQVTIEGYILPKDTLVIPNLYAVHHNEHIWGDPQNIRPERFLLEDGSVNRNHEAFIPFSVGRRVCPGEKLAKDQLFLFTTSLFQQFRVSTDPKKPKPTLEVKPTQILSPHSHELIFHAKH